MHSLATQSPPTTDWDAFVALNARRRAIREFDGKPLPDADVRAILSEALLAPSSGNLQSYELHWLRDPQLRAAVARACEGQRAATTASALIVVVARVAAGRDSLSRMRDYIEQSAHLDERSKAHHRRQLRKFGKFLRIAPWRIWAPFASLMAWCMPSLTLLPIGPSGIRHWAARSSVYAAQTLLLAASARGLDSCPMEGFSARALAKLLRLPRGSVVPVVIALGHRKPTARVEPRWRRPLSAAVIEH